MPAVGTTEPCIKHENMQGRKLCKDAAKPSIVDRPNFSQLFQRSKRLRIAARESGDRAAPDKNDPNGKYDRRTVDICGIKTQSRRELNFGFFSGNKVSRVRKGELKGICVPCFSWRL